MLLCECTALCESECMVICFTLFNWKQNKQVTHRLLILNVAITVRSRLYAKQKGHLCVFVFICTFSRYRRNPATLWAHYLFAWIGTGIHASAHPYLSFLQLGAPAVAQ